MSSSVPAEGASAADAPLCERHVHKMRLVQESEYCPAPGHQPPPAPYLATSLYDGARPGQPPGEQVSNSAEGST